jgi:hypothetical protein
MTICISIAILISLYYSTPDNYIIINKKLKDKNLKSVNLLIKSGQTYKINYSDIKNNNLAFDKSLDLIFKNYFKSQNYCYKKNSIIQSKFYSDIIIKNNTKEDMELKLFII